MLEVGDCTTFVDEQGHAICIGDTVYHSGLRKLFVVAFGWYEIKDKKTSTHHYGLHLVEKDDFNARHSFDIAYYQDGDECLIESVSRHDGRLVSTTERVLTMIGHPKN